MTVQLTATAVNLPEVAWHISTRSGSGGGNCAEAGPVLDGSGRVAVRHSRRPNGDVLLYDSVEWTAFLAGVKTGCFDSPV
jgi:hypothetical protein